MPTSHTWSYMQSHIDATIPDRVLHVITYRCQCPRCGLTREHISKILFHDICILVIPKVCTGLSGIVTRSKRIRKHSSQAYTHSTNTYILSHSSFQHIKLVFI
ncbi:Calmodulin-binding transcription activator 4 -like protein [Gossypium arboreum]|uniref:Calmodulin-binding transcription activator 4-like protein n=1 Tax=Gossypium arboreum TaxID=29729 RepID=A0A0B0NIF7_GOSAR|nr:Calmodulin-binding transcription activator 4 -like protein [Gossypium arboreum]